MAQSSRPKALLFDIGGVCLKSPFQAILNYEIGQNIPTGWVNYSISKTAPDGFWHRLERGEIPLDDRFYAGFDADLNDPTRWAAFYEERVRKEQPDASSRIPKVDGELLFNEMMFSSRALDPWMFPALQKLRSNGKFVVAALSNTIIFPETHELHVANSERDPLRRMFDLYLSSAHIGLRKPDPRIYQYAVRELDKFARDNASSLRAKGLRWEDGIQPNEVLFLDDIGENLKWAKKEGFQTIKVPLGRAYEAIDQLEAVTGLQLAGNHPRTPDQPKRRDTKARM